MLTVIDVIKILVRVFWVVDDECTSQTIAVLGGQVAMVPEGTGLIRDVKVVKERIVRNNRALINEGWTIGPICPCLEETMPMLVIRVSVAHQ